MTEPASCLYVEPADLGDADREAYEAALAGLFGAPVRCAGRAGTAGHTGSAGHSGSIEDAEELAAAVRAAGPSGSGLPLAFHSSGTTGRTTCAAYDAATRARHAAAVLAANGLTDDLTWCALPAPRYAYGLSVVESHAVAGIPVRFLTGPTAAARLADVAREAAAAHRPLAIYVTPQLVPVVLTAGLAPDAVRRVLVAGGRLSGGAARVLAARFPGVELTNMYGQAELGPRIATWRGPAAEFVEGDVGRPLDGVTVRIADPDDAGVGRILVTSTLAATALLRDPAPGPPRRGGPELTMGTEAGTETDTGDRGYLDGRGHLIHCGRGDHVLNVAGTRVDIEAVRAGVEALAPLAVRIAHRAARAAGDVIPVIEVVPAPGEALAARDVRRALHPVIGPLAALCDVRIVDHLDVGESGK